MLPVPTLRSERFRSNANRPDRPECQVDSLPLLANSSRDTGWQPDYAATALRSEALICVAGSCSLPVPAVLHAIRLASATFPDRMHDYLAWAVAPPYVGA